MFRFALFTCLLFSLLFLEKLPLSAEKAEMSKMLAVDFEVFGIVQGVFFRKYTQKRGQELGLKGWCMNTPNGTVVGHLEGEKAIASVFISGNNGSVTPEVLSRGSTKRNSAMRKKSRSHHFRASKSENKN